MGRNFWLIIVFLILLVGPVSAFPPPPPDQERIANEQVEQCESTGGVANKKYEGGYDPKTGIDRAWGVFVDCNCSEGYDWNSTVGCIKPVSIPFQTYDNSIEKEADKNLYIKVGILIMSILVICGILIKK